MRRGLVASRAQAQEAIRAGLVTIDAAPALKAATQVHAGQAIALAAPPRAYVSRGGEKLAHGLDVFDVDPTGRRCLDAGVSTGGFSDCLLQRGAAHVLAYDVGYGQVHERLRTDPRITVRERTNVRSLTEADVPPPPPDLLVADLSFISLATVLPTLRRLMSVDAEAVVLVKPQFEASRADVGKGGVVRDVEVWRSALLRVAEAGTTVGWNVVGVSASPLLGPAGNVEFLVHLVPVDTTAGSADAGDHPDGPGTLVDEAISEGIRRRDERHGNGQGRQGAAG